ncbi:MAG: segregation/condensation protein A, partial [Clostridia bacterium]|nr:segregation/condensation protein A [Clostridia bacterium]
MDELSFKLEIFEGPLDLLLSLIEKHKIDICDIEISLLLEQYMAYIEKAKEYNIELAADFLEMASTLLYIK